jgi:sarcosine oxidase subunit gamma
MDDALQAAPGLASNAGWQGDDLSMLVCPPSTIFHLEGPRDSVSDAMLPQAGRCMSDGAGMVLSVGPDVWLHVSAEADAAALKHSFRAAVDVSSAWSHLAFEGRKAVELLRKGCALDLHPRTFPAGACCATGFARMRVVLWRPTVAARYDMLVGRSYAQSLWIWLIDAAAQYGAPPTKESPQ